MSTVSTLVDPTREELFRWFSKARVRDKCHVITQDRRPSMYLTKKDSVTVQWEVPNATNQVRGVGQTVHFRDLIRSWVPRDAGANTSVKPPAQKQGKRDPVDVEVDSELPCQGSNPAVVLHEPTHQDLMAWFSKAQIGDKCQVVTRFKQTYMYLTKLDSATLQWQSPSAETTRQTGVTHTVNFLGLLQSWTSGD